MTILQKIKQAKRVFASLRAIEWYVQITKVEARELVRHAPDLIGGSIEDNGDLYLEIKDH